jgi:peptide/nickel transport system ATP-binding protein
VIQPAGVDLDQNVWRAVLDFREQVERGELVSEIDAIRGSSGDDADGEAVPAAVRERADLPETIADPAIEDAVSTAIDRLLDGDEDGAVDALADGVRTPCEAESPRDYETGAGWSAACLRHDERFDDPSAVERTDPPLSD